MWQVTDFCEYKYLYSSAFTPSRFLYSVDFAFTVNLFMLLLHSNYFFVRLSVPLHFTHIILLQCEYKCHHSIQLWKQINYHSKCFFTFSKWKLRTYYLSRTLLRWILVKLFLSDGNCVFLHCLLAIFLLFSLTRRWLEIVRAKNAFRKRWKYKIEYIHVWSSMKFIQFVPVFSHEIFPLCYSFLSIFKW